MDSEVSKKKQSNNQTPNTEHRKQSIRFAEWYEALKALVKLMAPFTPFIAEEIWVNVLGEKFSIHTSNWPKYDTRLIKEEIVTIVVQVNGKLRATLKVKAKRSRVKGEIVKLAKEDERIKKWLKGKKVKDAIFVPGKLVNFVTE